MDDELAKMELGKTRADMLLETMQGDRQGVRLSMTADEALRSNWGECRELDEVSAILSFRFRLNLCSGFVAEDGEETEARQLNGPPHLGIRGRTREGLKTG